MNNRFFDLAWNRQPDGTIRLTQTDCGDPHIVDAHSEQILFIARQLCGMKPDDANKAAELERRIAVLTDKLQDIVCNKAFRSDLTEGISDGFEYMAKLDGLLDLSLEFDGGRLLPTEHDMPIAPPATRKTASNNVSPHRQSETTKASQQMGLEV